MSLDSGFLKAIVTELKDTLLECKVDKVHQIDKDNLMIAFRGYKKASKLILCANANYARIHITEKQYENPMSPPMFCMLLRKHLLGARLIDVVQPDFERIAELCFEGYNELGEKNKKYLTIEIMGRHSNIIFYDEEKRIIDCIKHVDITMSMARQVLPGLLYEYPPAQNKVNPLLVKKEEIEELIESLAKDKRIDKELLGKFTGISPVVCREIAYRAAGTTDPCLEKFSQLQKDKLNFYLWNLCENLQNNTFKPTMLKERETTKPKEFSFMEIRQYGYDMIEAPYESTSQMLDDYYDLKDKIERIRQKSTDIFKVVMNNIERVSKKLTLQEMELKETENRDIYKIYGDLIMSNLYRMEKGQSQVTLENYYSDDLAPIAIELDILNTPSQNAQMYYRRYQKQKTKEQYLIKHMVENKKEILYLETIFDNIYKAENEKELNEMRLELKEQGYLLNKGKNVVTKKTAISKPMHFVSDDGYDIYVGKNNKQNDELTLKTADKWDLWLHTKNAPGSHTVIVTNGVELNEIPVETITQGAVLAATFSSAKESQNVAVDYALVRFVKKPSGAKPGMVIYDHFHTAYATPDELLAQRLRQDKVKK